MALKGEFLTFLKTLTGSPVDPFFSHTCRVFWKVGGYVLIGPYLLFCIYSIARISGNCNIQVIQSSQHSFVKIAEIVLNAQKTLYKCREI